MKQIYNTRATLEAEAMAETGVAGDEGCNAEAEALG